ncbi:MAG TPA: AMIN domain-containing protein, partial [Candidatus Eremiobacteraceae bacterium]|nr:AMIN domain-containing protein [Candidatus Eremiobacteraceae bacterium]
MILEVIQATTARLATRAARLASFTLCLSLVCGLLWPSSADAGGATKFQGFARPYRVAADSILQYVQSQQLPNGRVRILFQFSGPVQARAAAVGTTANYAVQFFGATLAPTVPNMIPVNLPPIQAVSVTQLGNTLNVTVAMTTPARPKLINAPGNLAIIEVPQAGGYQQPQGGYQTPPPTQAAAGASQTQIIRLRFADVSEVVGILSGNANVTPGNVFNPQ